MSDAKAQVSYDYDTGRITTFLISTQHQEDTSVMDIRLLVEAVMETAGKIKNDNMSNQDFYKFQFAAISRRGGVTPPYEQIGSIVVGAVSLSGMASSMRNTSLLISPIVQTTLYLPSFSCTVVRWTRRGGSSCVSASRRARPL